MSNDNKTLADAQPGGRVRLGDQAERARFEAWVKNHVSSLARAADGEYASNFTHALWSAWQDALSAQSSPGGQDALEMVGANLRSIMRLCRPEDYSISRLDAANIHMEALHALQLLESALAARQPVWEPVTVEAVATVRRDGDGDRYIEWLTEGGIADLEVGDTLMVSDRAITDEDGSGEVYATPRAQAVDLGAVREALQAAEGLATICASVDGYSREEVAASGRAMKQQFTDALAKVDSQAVGNG